MILRKRKFNQDKVCIIPFIRYGVNVDGSVELCCSAWMKGNVFAGNVYKTDFNETWNSPVARAIRKSVTNGTFSCCTDKCPYLNESLPNRDQIPEFLKDVIHFPQKDLKLYPKYIKLNNDPSCNLYCPSCRKDRQVLERFDSENVFENNMRIIYPLLRHADEFDLLGSGEVFASKATLRLINNLDTNIHGNLRLHLLTNGILFDPKGWARLSNIHGLRIKLNVSIDAGTKDTYEKLRRGGRFETLLKNLEFIKRLKSDNYIAELVLNVTIQKDNFQEMPLIADIARKYSADRIILFRLVNWGSFTNKEYVQRDVSHTNHPEHERLRAVFSDETLDDIVEIGAFNYLRSSNPQK